MGIQAFKENDATELKVRNCFVDLLSRLSADRDDFYSGAYMAYPLGDVLAATGSPVSESIDPEVFRQSFFSLYESFQRPGTFEFYLSLIRTIWGADVEVEFTVPSPGTLEIDITALSSVANLALARRIEDNEYVDDEILDHDGDNLIFQGTQGLQTQREADAIFLELAPIGIWTVVTLSIS
jgi:hypothetical protein